ncbi:MAG: NAD-dependent epimerase/dehydratase family protein [Candidatus Sericytochromatia bacterium]
MTPRLLLTGATGMAGRALLSLLLERTDFRIRAVHATQQAPVLELSAAQSARLEFCRGDLRQAEVCAELVKGCTHAVLAAAHSSGAAESALSPGLQVNQNLLMNIHLLEQLSRQQELQRVIFISSATVYPEMEGRLREDALDLNLPPAPAHLGVAGVMRYLESACRFWESQAHAPFTVVRAANIYGPYAKFDPARANFIPALIRKAVAADNPFAVWGSPDTVRDVIFTRDFAQGVLALLNLPAPAFPVYNLGSGQPVTVAGVVEAALAAARHVPDAVIYQSDRPRSSAFRLLDCQRLQQETGWAPEVDMPLGVALTTAWWQDHQHHWTR